MLGQLLAQARKEFQDSSSGHSGRDAFKEQYAAALETLRTNTFKQVEQVISETASRMLSFLGSQAMKDVQIQFGLADPANPYASVRLEFSEAGCVIPGEELGLGLQSAMVVGIFEAFRQVGGQIGTILLEEPEMYLHPQAQRYFYKLLRDLVENRQCQVIYSTHSPLFANASQFESIRVIRRANAVSSCSFVREQSDTDYLTAKRDAQKLLTQFTASRSELFFANKCILVEGPGDQLAVRLVAGRIGVDLDAENFAVVECGSKSGIPFFAKICQAFGIPFAVIHDLDIYEVEGVDERQARIRQQNEETARINDEIRSVTDPAKLFTFDPSFEAVLGIGRSANDKPRRVIEILETKDVAELPNQLVDCLEGFTPTWTSREWRKPLLSRLTANRNPRVEPGVVLSQRWTLAVMSWPEYASPPPRNSPGPGRLLRRF